MHKTREIMRLSMEMGLSKREIARILAISHNTVSDHLNRAQAANLAWPLPDSISEEDLENLLFPRGRHSASGSRATPDFDYVRKELSKKGVTLQLLWIEYKKENPDAYQYSHFCDLYKVWKKGLDISMRQVHKGGEKLFVDWAGPTVPIIDQLTGETQPAYIFVAVLGASNYTYAEASLSLALPSWISAHCRTFEYLGGVPLLIVPDNTKTAVIKADYYEPTLNQTYLEMANHYGTTIVPARTRRPKDKAKVETGVQIVERWLLAPYRNRSFFSIHELNQTLKADLLVMNNKPFQKLEGSRSSHFESLDKPNLKPLPACPYEFALWKKPRVNIDYHIQVDNNFYSVPYQMVHKQLDARVSASTLEVFYKGERIASHVLCMGKGNFRTEPEHLAPAHRKHMEWTPERLISWASRIGPQTEELVRQIIISKAHPEQGYRACLGIMRLARNYSPERVENASRRALSSGAISYRSVSSILDKGLDKIEFQVSVPVTTPASLHDNIRGSEYYREEEETC